MKNSSLAIFHSLVGNMPSRRREKMLSFLPEEERKKSVSFVPKEDWDVSIFSLDSLMERVHYSWYLPTLKAYAKKDIILFLLSLSDHLQKKLSAELAIELPQDTLTPTASNYLRNLLQTSLLDNTELLPKAFLPKSYGKQLADLSQKELLHIIEGLSMLDLAYEIKHIVDPKKLKAIQNALTEWQKEFLRSHPTISIPSFPDKMGLDRWDGEVRPLQSLLHKRGLKHLAIALAQEHPNVIWYVVHHLDIGRGGALLRLLEKKMTSNLAPAIMQAIVQIMKNL